MCKKAGVEINARAAGRSRGALSRTMMSDYVIAAEGGPKSGEAPSVGLRKVGASG